MGCLHLNCTVFGRPDALLEMRDDVVLLLDELTLFLIEELELLLLDALTFEDCWLLEAVEESVAARVRIVRSVDLSETLPLKSIA